AERELGGYLAFCDGEAGDPAVADLLRFAAIAVLEDVSYTRKDGQYLRWDPRCGRPGVRGRLDKGRLPSLREAVVRQLERMARDLAGAGPRAGALPGTRGRLDLRQGSCLGLLPRRDSGSVDFVLTSPPYCNRYDYTRTYALELALLGLTDAGVKDLRQRMLSCTVENKEKRGQLRAAWEQAGRAGAFEAVEREFAGHEALQEVLGLLEAFRVSGKLNNSNIARMVRNYFYEMCFVVYELARVLAPGGRAVMVNDDVRYAGEEVPVDLILSDFAAAFGLRVRHIWTLPRGKGNSSQQMGAHGRRELRKCVYVWEKPRR
ncbi:MAG: site-specific DNA-methyltransferase, partial [Gemmatimonadetes bacterium]|nr:site-specific DNA-methyltransferase [Gemmatimonadota bacterium]